MTEGPQWKHGDTTRYSWMIWQDGGMRDNEDATLWVIIGVSDLWAIIGVSDIWVIIGVVAYLGCDMATKMTVTLSALRRRTASLARRLHAVSNLISSAVLVSVASTSLSCKEEKQFAWVKRLRIFMYEPTKIICNAIIKLYSMLKHQFIYTENTLILYAMILVHLIRIYCYIEGNTKSI